MYPVTLQTIGTWWKKAIRELLTSTGTPPTIKLGAPNVSAEQLANHKAMASTIKALTYLTEGGKGGV